MCLAWEFQSMVRMPYSRCWHLLFMQVQSKFLTHSICLCFCCYFLRLKLGKGGGIVDENKCPKRFSVSNMNKKRAKNWTYIFNMPFLKCLLLRLSWVIPWFTDNPSQSEVPPRSFISFSVYCFLLNKECELDVFRFWINDFNVLDWVS